MLKLLLLNLRYGPGKAAAPFSSSTITLSLLPYHTSGRPVSNKNQGRVSDPPLIVNRNLTLEESYPPVMYWTVRPFSRICLLTSPSFSLMIRSISLLTGELHIFQSTSLDT